MPSNVFHLKVSSFRTNATPLDSQNVRSYQCVVPVSEIPDAWSDWLGINARESSLTGRVPKAIRNTLMEEPDWFVAYNRGLTVLASKVSYDNRQNVATIQFDQKNSHGVLDGGHTLAVILDQRDTDGVETQSGACCRVEILTGVPEDRIADLVDARNTSRQVQSKSLLNLGRRFDDLKSILKKAEVNGKSFEAIVSWRENEDAEFDVRELIALLTAVDKVHYDDKKHPIVTYTGKEACLRHFEDYEACYEGLYHLAPTLLRLWDTIQFKVPEQYIARGGRFGGLTGCNKLKKERELPFIGESTQYQFPTAYLYPIVASFRSMLVKTPSGRWEWGKGLDPLQLVEDGLAKDIFADAVFNSIRTYRSPNKTGKDSNVWSLAYRIAENQYLRAPG